MTLLRGSTGHHCGGYKGGNDWRGGGEGGREEEWRRGGNGEGVKKQRQAQNNAKKAQGCYTWETAHDYGQVSLNTYTKL